MSSIIHLLNLVALRQYWNNYDFVSHSLGMIEPSLSFPERKYGLRGSQPLRRAHGTAWKSVPISAGSRGSASFSLSGSTGNLSASEVDISR